MLKWEPDGSTIHFERDRDGIGSYSTGVGQDGIYFFTLAWDWDKTGYIFWEWDGTGVKIHSRVML